MTDWQAQWMPVPGWEDLYEVSIDNNPENNAVANLEWCTQAENLQHAVRQGRLDRAYWKGKRTPAARLTDEQVRSLRARRALYGTPYTQLGPMFGVSKCTAMRCAKRETYSDVR